MGTIDNLIRNDAALVFADPNFFGESITYRPARGLEHSARAFVVRNAQNEPDLGPSRGATRAHDVYVPNDATYGVTSVEVGTDLVDLVDPISGETHEYRVVDIVNRDEGFWQLRVVR